MGGNSVFKPIHHYIAIRMKLRYYFLTTFAIVFSIPAVSAQGDGLLIKEGKRLFPIGWYHMPKDDASLKEMADAGINLINCNSKEELDRAHAAGIQGWMPLSLQQGVTDALKKKVGSVAGHPALAIWHGPDEIVLSFTQDYQFALSGPETPIVPWRDQTPEMAEYARQKSPPIMAKMIEAISYIRSVDSNNLQLWINEGAHSAPMYVRQYLNAIDITGCDYYPINGHRRSRTPPTTRVPSRRIGLMGYTTEQWKEIGMGKPVYMVLQAFSWPDLGQGVTEKASSPAYPSFYESRFMAYDVIAHGGRGIFYYGGFTISSDDFRQSLYCLTSELDALQPFLAAPEKEHVSAYVMKDFKQPPSGHEQEVAWCARQYGRDWMVALVNDTDSTLQSVVVKGLRQLNGLKFVELYGEEEVTVDNEEFITRLRPREVKVFATGKKWESSMRSARDYQGIPAMESRH
jgi:hypothetical protein